MIPATPSTPAQHDRYQRMLLTAESMLAGGGEDSLQMKELAVRSAVSLAALYRYFPSKDHVLLAIAYHQYEKAFQRVSNETPKGATIQDRATSHLLREFNAMQRDQWLAAVLTRVLADTRSEYAQALARTHQMHVQVLKHVVGGGEPIDDDLCQRLQIVLDISRAAMGRWLAGVSSAAEARFDIRIGCYLLSRPE